MKRQFKIIMVVLCVCTLIGTVAVGLSDAKGGDAEKDILVISREDEAERGMHLIALLKKMAQV